MRFACHELNRIRLALPRRGAQAVTFSLALLAWPGCTPGSPDRLVVATSWPSGERKRLETEFQRWVAASDGQLSHRRVPASEWLGVAAQDDPVKLARRARAPQVFLGGAEAFELLANPNELLPIDHAGGARWCTITRGDEALTARSAAVATAAWSDPRGDRASLRWAMSELALVGWREGYARLIRTAAVRERFGRSSASSAVAPTVDVVAIARNAADGGLAQAFLRFLCETQAATAGGSLDDADMGTSAPVCLLVADLVGATLVDAQDELWTAWRALERLADRERALAWLVEPPPWPPASVSRYLGRDGERAMALIETLSVEVAPAAPARAWLKRSWLSPARLVDQAFLAELSEAAGGELCREPRFRAWLREEWTAWARQRYRRVARWAGSGAGRPGDKGASTLP